ncbi:MAG: DUF3783 domain-containing protein [Niameybacter sp.]|uniref:DUF3783 domain-containing protein n=1 Tax=Niameybacter sp. TaxID=2033640 RepID=UPI002FCC2460
MLEDNPLQATASIDIPMNKTIVFNHVPSNRTNAFIEGLKKFRLPRPLMATVTDTSIHWTFEVLIQNLAAERHALKNNTMTTHA